MLMDSTLDTDGTAFICPECSFNGTSLPELISHLNETHGEGLFICIVNWWCLMLLFLFSFRNRDEKCFTTEKSSSIIEWKAVKT